MTCEMPRLGWWKAITPWRVVAGVGGALCFASAWRLAPERPAYVVPLLLPAGSILIFFGIGLPISTAVLADVPVLKVFAALTDRERALCERIQRRLAKALHDVAADVVLDDERANHVVEMAIERVAAHWRGPVTERFDCALFCWVVHFALWDSRSTPTVDEDDPRVPLARLERRDRAVIALRRHSLTDDQIRCMVGYTAQELDGVPLLIKETRR